MGKGRKPNSVAIPQKHLETAQAALAGGPDTLQNIMDYLELLVTKSPTLDEFLGPVIEDLDGVCVSIKTAQDANAELWKDAFG